MRAALSILFLAVAMPTVAAQQHNCPPGTDFAAAESDEIHDAPYDLKYTSGYQSWGTGYRFIYCIHNVSNDAMFDFKWAGPRPDQLSKGSLAYGQAYTEGWLDSDAGPDALADRTLYLGRHHDYDREIDVSTYFKMAAAGDQAAIALAQYAASGAEAPLDADRLYGKLRDSGGNLVRTSGIRFDMPSNPQEWERYVYMDGEPFASSPISVTAYAGVKYSLERQAVIFFEVVAAELPGEGSEDREVAARVLQGITIRSALDDRIDGLADGAGPLLVPGNDWRPRNRLQVYREAEIRGLPDLLDNQAGLELQELPVSVALPQGEVSSFYVEMIAPMVP